MKIGDAFEELLARILAPFWMLYTFLKARAIEKAVQQEEAYTKGLEKGLADWGKENPGKTMKDHPNHETLVKHIDEGQFQQLAYPPPLRRITEEIELRTLEDLPPPTNEKMAECWRYFNPDKPQSENPYLQESIDEMETEFEDAFKQKLKKADQPDDNE